MESLGHLGGGAVLDNVLIGEDGLLFHNDEYETAAYARGPTNLRVPWELINELAKPRFR